MSGGRTESSPVVEVPAPGSPVPVPGAPAALPGAPVPVPGAPAALPGARGPAATPRVPDAVLWDLDGTLVDTEPYWIAEEFALVAEHHGRWSLEDAHALVGNDLLVSARYIREHGGVDLPPERIVAILLDGVVRRVAEHIPWRPGAGELLSALTAAGIPCALVTMSYRRLAEAVVSALPPGTFATLVTGDEVTLGKPHPEPYLVAAARLGVTPPRCLAIEDSPTGVASAEAAGVPVLAVPHLVPIPPSPGRRLVATLVGLGPADLLPAADSYPRPRERSAPDSWSYIPDAGPVSEMPDLKPASEM